MTAICFVVTILSSAAFADRETESCEEADSAGSEISACEVSVPSVTACVASHSADSADQAGTDKDATAVITASKIVKCFFMSQVPPH